MNMHYLKQVNVYWLEVQFIRLRITYENLFRILVYLK